MGRFLNLKQLHFERKNTSFNLALCVILGLISGIVFSDSVGDSFGFIVSESAICPASRSGLLTAVLLPVLLSVFAGSIRAFWLLFPIAFTKAFLAGFAGFGVMHVYGSAGWLIRWLLLFSECCTLPLLILFWMYQLSGKGSGVVVSALAVLAAVLIVNFDFYVVSPFLASVLS